MFFINIIRKVANWTWTMTSTNIRRSRREPPAPEYEREVIGRRDEQWNIKKSTRGTCLVDGVRSPIPGLSKKEMEQIIIGEERHKQNHQLRSDFIEYEKMNTTANSEEPKKEIRRSFPRHRALVMASLGSMSKIVEDISSVKSKTETMMADDLNTKKMLSFARAVIHHSSYRTQPIIHDDIKPLTYFTEQTPQQREKLLTYSGIAGVAISRLFGISGGTFFGKFKLEQHQYPFLKKHALITAKYAHSIDTCEVVIGNRYYMNLPKTSPINMNIPSLRGQATLTTEDITPERVKAVLEQLLELYEREMPRLEKCIAAFKRGFMSLDVIVNDPQFILLISTKWMRAKQLMKIRDFIEEEQNAIIGPYHGNERVQSELKRFIAVSNNVFTMAEVPKLYDYDVAHLFDNKRQSFSKFIKTSKDMLIRLSNSGLLSAFLSFAKIHPQMVTDDVHPRLGLEYMGVGMAKSCMNHIPTSHPVWGELRLKLRHIIPRTAEILNADQITFSRPQMRINSMPTSTHYQIYHIKLQIPSGYHQLQPHDRVEPRKTSTRPRSGPFVMNRRRKANTADSAATSSR